MIGDAEIIRLLLNAKAEPNYKNRREFLCVDFLWEPERPPHARTCEIMDIFHCHGFDAWNDVDTWGWSPCHRAGAYGSGEEILALEYQGVNLHMYTTRCLWGPMTVAVWHKNTSTFDTFMDLFPTQEILNITDSRGWTLLHMAAQNGNEHILKRLSDAGANTTVKTMGTTEWVCDSIKGKCLTAADIAQAYDYGHLWDRLTQDANPEAPT